jgi:hypothetical protein
MRRRIRRKDAMMHDISTRYTVDELSVHVHDEDNDDGDPIKDSVQASAPARESLDHLLDVPEIRAFLLLELTSDRTRISPRISRIRAFHSWYAHR